MTLLYHKGISMQMWNFNKQVYDTSFYRQIV